LTPPLRILVVDDDPLMRRALQRLLVGLGYGDVHVAANADEAVDAARRLAPRLVLLDHNLGDSDGIEVLRRLRDAPETASAALVTITASIVPGLEDRAAAAGCDAFLPKPFDIKTLASTLERVLRARGLMEVGA
jgi:CheY-like chemotaxis protein